MALHRRRRRRGDGQCQDPLSEARTWTDTYFAVLAGQYAGLVQAGARRPIALLATQRRERPSRLRDAIHQARVRGWLTEGLRGRCVIAAPAGGQRPRMAPYVTVTGPKEGATAAGGC